MAYLFGKFKRFYGASDEEMLKMPARRFFAYLKAIKKIQAEELLMLASTVGSLFAGDESRSFLDQLAEDAEIKEEPSQILDPVLFSSIGIKIEKKE